MESEAASLEVGLTIAQIRRSAELMQGYLAFVEGKIANYEEIIDG